MRQNESILAIYLSDIFCQQLWIIWYYIFNMRRRSKAIENQAHISEQLTDTQDASDSVIISSIGLNGQEKALALQKIITIEALLKMLSLETDMQFQEKYVVIPAQRNTYLKIAKPQKLREVQLCNSDTIVAESLSSLFKRYKQKNRSPTLRSGIGSVPLIKILSIFYADDTVNFPLFSTLDQCNKIQIQKTVENLKISHRSIFFFITFDPTSQHSRSYSIDHEIAKMQSNPESLAQANAELFSYFETPSVRKIDTPFGKKQIGFKQQTQEEQTKKIFRLTHHKHTFHVPKQKLVHHILIQEQGNNSFIQNSHPIPEQNFQISEMNSVVKIPENFKEGRIITPPKIRNEDFDMEDTEQLDESSEEDAHDNSWLKNPINLGCVAGRETQMSLMPMLDKCKIQFQMEQEFEDDF